MAKDRSKWRMTEEANGHRFGFWNKDTLESCRDCGGVRRADKKDPPCPGRPRVAFRAPRRGWRLKRVGGYDPESPR